LAGPDKKLGQVGQVRKQFGFFALQITQANVIFISFMAAPDVLMYLCLLLVASHGHTRNRLNHSIEYCRHLLVFLWFNTVAHVQMILLLLISCFVLVVNASVVW
jgi:succinate dehydrogenase hydrophobic anchor subunit